MPDLPRRRRPERPSWTEPIAQRLTPAIKVLVITDALLFFTFVFSDAVQPLMRNHLALGPSFLGAHELWQPLTALFIHFRPLSFVFSMIGLWWVGASVERLLGTRRFLALFFASGILGHVAAGVVSRLTGTAFIYEGCSLAVLALFVAFGRLYGREMMQVLGALVLQARQLTMLFVGFALVQDLIQGFAQGDWGSLAGTVVAVTVGYLGAAPGGLRELYDLVRARRLRRRYRVIEGGAARRSRSPKYWN